MRVFFSPEEQQQIIDSLDYLISTEEAPEGYLTIADFANKYGISITPIYSKMDELEISGTDFKDKRSAVCLFLSPEEQQQIIDSLDYLISAEEAPEGYLTAKAFSNHTGISQTTISKAINDLDIKGDYYRGKTGIDIYLSPEQQQQIIDSLDYLISAEEAPEGYLTVNSLAPKYGISPGALRKRVDELGIQGSPYKNREGVIHEYLSPEQQETLFNFIETIERTFSQSSIPENTIVYYLKKAGQPIIQGLRPDWLKNPDTGCNLEVDVFLKQLQIGIEYDGWYWHQDVDRDIKKDQIAQESGYSIIHIREEGCPELLDGSICIERKNNDDDNDLEECIRACFRILDLAEPDINIMRDKREIMTFMREKTLGILDSVKSFEELPVTL